MEMLQAVGAGRNWMLTPVFGPGNCAFQGKCTSFERLKTLIGLFMHFMIAPHGS